MQHPHTCSGRTEASVPVEHRQRVRAALTWMSALAVAALSCGCFGGGGNDGSAGTSPPMATSVPDSALASATAYTQFTLTTSQTASDITEPLTADNVTVPPATDTDEPVPVS